MQCLSVLSWMLWTEWERCLDRIPDMPLGLITREIVEREALAG